MVSTRRSGSVSTEQLPEPPTTRRRRGQQSTSGTGAVQGQPIAEEEEDRHRTSTAGTEELQPTPAAGRRTRASGRKATAAVAQQEEVPVQQQEQQQPPQQPLLHDPASQPQSQVQVPAARAAAGSSHPRHVATSPQVAAQHPVVAQDNDDDPWADISSDSDNEADQQAEDAGHGRLVMDNLAASIRAAFQAKVGLASKPTQQKSQAQHSGLPARQQLTAGQAEAKDPDLQGAQMHWQPAVPLPSQKAPTREVLKTSIQAEKEKGLAKQLLAPTREPKALRKQQTAAKPDTAGKGWYDLPAQKIDDNLKRELRLLRLRGAYDPKRFYKSYDNTKFPKHFAMGTVVEGPAEYYSGRLEAAQRRKATLTEQLMADAQLTQVRKKRYAKLQEEATKHQRVKKRKTELPRLPKSHHRPKH